MWRSFSMEMDTPERTQIASSSTPISKFEDSPVFNYINNLSPIKPVKSIHITQTFSSLTFASLPSIFTSPHVSSHKESRFLRRHQNLDTSKLKGLSGDVERASTNEEAVAELPENFEAGISIASASVEQLSENTEFAIELPRTLKYDCGSPDCGSNREICIQKVHDIDQPEGEAGPGNKQTGPGCDWDSLVSDSADLLIFSSPNDAEAFRGIIQKSPGLETGLGAHLSSSFLQNNINSVQKMQLFFQVASGEHPEIGDASESIEIKHTQEDLGCDDLESMGIYPGDVLEDDPAPHGSFADMKPLSNFQRGMRRRCLDFEMVGAHHRKSLPDSSSYSSSLSHSEDKIASKNLHLTSVNNKRGGGSSRCILPGIGLHLNSLASATKDYKSLKHDALSSETQISDMTGQELLSQPMIPSASEKEADESGNTILEDTSQALVLLNPEELNPNSPRKKRRRVEHGGEAEACKRCNCKKSKCLKLYCECFAAGVYCIEPCACQDCFNKPIHEDTVLATRKQIESRNPLAFAPKVIRSSDSIPEIGDESMKTPASARHKRGCNCKKSSCLKKYCECYQGGVGCSINCRCEGCKNVFGTKDGSILVGTDGEAAEDEAEKFEKTGLDVISLKTENPRTEEQVHSVLPSTPSGLSRPPGQMAFPLSKGKPPRSSFLTTIGSSYVLNGTQKLGKTEFVLPGPPKFEKPPQMNAEDEMPEILRGSTTPNASVKTASPNRKRVSPPHGEFGSSPSLRSGRRLILQSIPSFPSLTPQH